MRLTDLRLRQVVAAIILVAAVIPLSASEPTAGSRKALQQELEEYVESVGESARVGVAVIIGGRDVVGVRADESFPMMSVYKFPQALALAESGVNMSDSVMITASQIQPDTWSPMRDRYGQRNLRLPLSELLAYSLQQSDNNACDVIFDLLGGPSAVADYLAERGFAEIRVCSTEAEMKEDNSLALLNSSTPRAMARLLEFFFSELRDASASFRLIGELMETCETGRDRLRLPLEAENAIFGHKTGSGYRTPEGCLMACNDVGYVCFPDGRRYSIAVFITDSTLSDSDSAALIADISAITLRHLR